MPQEKERPPAPGKGKGQEKHRSNSSGIAAGRQVISYNLRRGKGRIKIRIATGKRAKGNRRARVITEVPR